jgi:sulfate adenylyltransferase subunit 1 (EFTu-like GTPase family)
LLEGLLVLNVKVVVVDTQQPSDLNNLSELANHKAGQIIWYNPEQDDSGRGREEKEIDRLLLAADIAVIFHHHEDLIKLLMNYGVVIVAEETSVLLENYKPNEETGNAFLFDKHDLWSVFAAMVRALETFKFPYDWQHIVRKLFR